MIRILSDIVLREYNRTNFPGGEVHIRLNQRSHFSTSREGNVAISADIHSSDDVMALLMITDALKRDGAKEITLCIPYLPYARQDRVCSSGEALSLKVFCQLINAQNYKSVKVWDVHSDVALALLDRVTNVPATDFLRDFSHSGKIGWKNTVLVAPDAGAIKKVSEACKQLGTPFIRADKTRDLKTGAITGTQVYSDNLGEQDVLIVDDICDGGRTFIELAKVLRPMTTGKLMLYVTHGIFSQGTQVLSETFDKVFVAKSFPDKKTLPLNFHHA